MYIEEKSSAHIAVAEEGSPAAEEGTLVALEVVEGYILAGWEAVGAHSPGS